MTETSAIADDDPLAEFARRFVAEAARQRAELIARWQLSIDAQRIRRININHQAAEGIVTSTQMTNDK